MIMTRLSLDTVLLLLHNRDKEAPTALPASWNYWGAGANDLTDWCPLSFQLHATLSLRWDLLKFGGVAFGKTKGPATNAKEARSARVWTLYTGLVYAPSHAIGQARETDLPLRQKAYTLGARLHERRP